MVGAGTAAIKDLEAAILAVGDGDDEFFKRVCGHVAGAGAGDEEAAGLDELEGELVEIVVFGVAGLVLGVEDELRWIGDDEVPLAAIFNHGAHPGEGIGVGEFDASAVEVGVPLGHGDGGFVKVDGGDFTGSGEGGTDAEAASVAAEV